MVALSCAQVGKLPIAAAKYPTLSLRILLAVMMGLRQGEIGSIRVGDPLFNRIAVTTRSRKSRKAMAERPVLEGIRGSQKDRLDLAAPSHTTVQNCIAFAWVIDERCLCRYQYWPKLCCALNHGIRIVRTGDAELTDFSLRRLDGNCDS